MHLTNGLGTKHNIRMVQLICQRTFSLQ